VNLWNKTQLFIHPDVSDGVKNIRLSKEMAKEKKVEFITN